MRLRPFGLGIALSASALSGSWAQERTPTVVLKPSDQATVGTVSVNLREADAGAISQALSNALRAIVRIEGAVASPVTLELHGVSGRAALDAVAVAVRGTWKPAYSLTEGVSPSAARPPVTVGRTVTADLTGVSARTALSLVARGAGGSVEMVSELPQPVTLKVEAMPVEQALDEIARQVGGNWSATYVIRPGTAPAPKPTPPGANPVPATSSPRQSRLSPSPAPSRSLPRGLVPEGVPEDGLNDRRSFPKPFETQPPAAPRPDPNAAKMLGEGMIRMMQMPPAQRRAAVKDFASQIDQQFRQMQSLPAARRTEQMAAMRPLYQAATRTYSGLTPDQKREFQPIVEAFNRWMR
jgi:hypothetical protein